MGNNDRLCPLTPKTYSYLTADNNENEKAGLTKKYVIKNLKFEDYKFG